MTSAHKSQSQRLHCRVFRRITRTDRRKSHSSPPGIAAARVTRRRFDAEPGVHIKLDKRGDGVAPVEGDTVQVNYSGRVKGKSQCRNITDLHAIDATEPTHRSMPHRQEDRIR